jgi:hypothetical protein
MTRITKQVISPLDIATKGRLSKNPITIATRGYIVYLTEEIVEEVVPVILHGGGDTSIPSEKDKKRKKKVITATVQVGGVTITETVETYDTSLKLTDVKVEIVESNDKPTLKIVLP